MVSVRGGKHLVSNSMSLQSFLESNVCFRAKSFISLNPFFGCDVGCRYCYRLSHANLFDVFLSPRRFVSDEETLVHLEKLLAFQDNGIPIALHDSSTDPFLPVVFDSTLRLIHLIKKWDENRRIVIISKVPINALNVEKIKEIGANIIIFYGLSHLPMSIEPIDLMARIETLKEISKQKIANFIHFRPIIPLLNDSLEVIERVLTLAEMYSLGTIIGGIQVTSPVIYKSISLPAIVIERAQNEKFLDVGFTMRVNRVISERHLQKPVFYHNSEAIKFMSANKFLERMEN